MHLHEAIIKALNDKGGLTPKEIADVINSENTYQRKDGRPLRSNQISARINKYPHLFNKIGNKIYPNNKEDSETQIKNKKSTKKAVSGKIIAETKCVCNQCKNVWFYGKREQLENFFNSQSNLGKDMMCCGGCFPALFIPDKKVVDHNKCPRCGSRSIVKEIVNHHV